MNIEKYYDLLLAGTRTVRCQAVQAIENLIDLPPALLIDIEQKGLEYTAASISPKNRIQVSEYFEDKSAELSVFSDSSGFEIKAILGGALEIRNCHDFRLNLMEIKNIEKKNREKFHIRIIGCRNFVVFGGKHIGLRNFILVSESRDFVLRDFDVVGCDGYGVVIFNSLFFRVINASFKKCLASGVYCLGKTMYGKIEKTKFIGGRGYFNWDAGLHINHCTNAIDINDIPEKSHENASIVDKLNKPSYIYVKDCDFINNRAQGIYCEGGNNIYISNCVIKGNNKEGVCFDWGSAMNGFYSNHVLQNGNRAALTAEEIKADFIERYPLLADGSSSCKLAGVSIDNGVFNFIKNNVFLGNYGGGVKMVRTGISNLIMDNLFFENGIGSNEHFRHYNAVSMLGMGVGDTEFSDSTNNLDFLPSTNNVIVGNRMFGSTHYHGVFSSKPCVHNYASGNYMYDVGGTALSDNILRIGD